MCRVCDMATCSKCLECRQEEPQAIFLSPLTTLGSVHNNTHDSVNALEHMEVVNGMMSVWDIFIILTVKNSWEVDISALAGHKEV